MRELEVRRILLVDDHPIFRQGMQDLLSAEYPNASIGEVSNGQEALELITTKTWDLILLDASMPILDGFEVLQEMRKRHIKIPVLMVSVHPESQFGEWALRAGAADYISKQDPLPVLLEAIRRLLPATADFSLGG